MARVNLALLSRAELERLVFTTTRALREVVDAVRANAKDQLTRHPGWKESRLSREVERIAADLGARVEPHVDRTAVDRLGAVRAERNARYWVEVSDGAAAGKPPH